MKKSTFEAKDLSKSYGSVDVVTSVSCSIKSGEAVGLLGPNGAGKTTSFYMMTGLVRPDSGGVYLDGEDVTELSISAKASVGISYLPQNASIFRGLTVEQNLLAAAQVAGIPRNLRTQGVEDTLERFSITHVARSLGATLSGGERRRVEIARALMMNPSFLLLDEPFAGIDPIAVQSLQAMIGRLCEDGLGVLITDHNFRELLDCCDRSYVLASGQIIAVGDQEELRRNRKVREVYLGENDSFEARASDEPS